MAYEPNGFNGSGPIHFTNVRILDATGEYPYTGEVLIQGNRIKQVTRGSSRLGGSSSSNPMHGGATVIDGMGATLMPGLIDAHLHLSWNNAPGIDPIQMMELEEHMLVTMEMAKLVLAAGFTAAHIAVAFATRLEITAFAALTARLEIAAFALRAIAAFATHFSAVLGKAALGRIPVVAPRTVTFGAAVAALFTRGV